MNWQCALLQRWLPEYPDGDLPTFWLRRLKPHVERCGRCRQELAALKEVAQTIRTAKVADPGPEFWSEFSRELHLKLVQAAEKGEMAPARSPWWGRIPYLVGASALAVLLLWMAVSHLTPRQAGLTSPQIAQQKAPKAQLAVVPEPAGGEGGNSFLFVANNHGDETTPEEGLGDDLDATLSGMTPQQKEIFLKRLSQQQKDGSCLKSYSSIFCA
jgi:hypothetical protein